jgi:hypothetical protein
MANPAYREREPWRLGGPWLWAWRGVMAAWLTWLAVSGSWIGVGLFAAAWVFSEVKLRRS